MTAFSRQLPSEREGLGTVLSSSMLNVLCEAAAALGDGYRIAPVRDRYVRQLVERRRRAGAARAAAWAKRKEKWADIRAGVRAPDPVAIVLGGRYSSSSPVDRLLAAVRSQGGAQDDGDLYSIGEAAQRLGMRPATLRQRLDRGSVRRVVTAGGVRVPASEVERLNEERTEEVTT